MNTIGVILNRLGYKLRRVQKTKPLKKIPETDAIFENVRQENQTADDFPDVVRISIDAKAKVNVGDFSGTGSPAAETPRALDHDTQAKKKLDFIRNKDFATVSVAACGSEHEDCVIHKPLPWPNPRLRLWCSVRHLSQCGSVSRQRGHARH